MFRKALHNAAYVLSFALAIFLTLGGVLSVLGGFLSALANEDASCLWISAAGLGSVGVAAFFASIFLTMSQSRQAPPPDNWFNRPRFRFDNPN